MGEKKTKKKKETQERVEELTELLQRTQASLENYRKQTEKRIQEIQELANKDLIIQLLTVLDNFELALSNTGSSEEFVKGAEKSKISGTTKNSFNEFLIGVELIYSQLLTVLENKGLKSIKTENMVFDPHAHEALMKENSDKPENTVLEELQKGYSLNDKVIRHVKVKVSAGKILEKEGIDEHNDKNRGGK